MRTAHTSSVALNVVASIFVFTGCARDGKHDVTSSPLVKLTRSQGEIGESKAASLDYDERSREISVTVQNEKSEPYVLKGQVDEGGTATLLAEQNGKSVGEAKCAGNEGCRRFVLNLYQKFGHTVRVQQFVSANLASRNAEGLFMGQALTRTGAKEIGAEAAQAPTEEQERAAGPWLDLNHGGIADGPPQTFSKGSESLYGQLENGTLLPAAAPTIRRMNDASQSWGAGFMISLLQNASVEFAKSYPQNVVCVGSIAKQTGGLFSPHSSHQNGIDADVYFMGQTKYETVLDGQHQVTDKFDKAKNWDFFRLLFRQKMIVNGKAISALSRIFLAPELKTALCVWAKETKLIENADDAEIMRRIRPTEGHDTHFHVRLHCSPHHPLCRQEPEAPTGTGC